MSQLSDVPGISVGHAHDSEKITGCTVILTGEEGAVAGVDVRGGAPGSRENKLLDPEKRVERVHGIFLTGGSAFGLEAAGGVMDYLREKKIGFPTGVIPVPIVPASVIFDLGVGSPQPPSADMARRACEKCSEGEEKTSGNLGAGYGATVGKIMGGEGMMKGGLGQASTGLKSGVKIGVLVVVNCFGNVIEADSGSVLAGTFDREKGLFIPAVSAMEEIDSTSRQNSNNTTLAVVATDAGLNKAEATKVAGMAQNGLARSISPAHTMFDGDSVYAISTGVRQADISLLGEKAALLVSSAIERAVRSARPLAGIPSHSGLVIDE